METPLHSSCWYGPHLLLTTTILTIVFVVFVKVARYVTVICECRSLCFAIVTVMKWPNNGICHKKISDISNHDVFMAHIFWIYDVFCNFIVELVPIVCR